MMDGVGGTARGLGLAMLMVGAACDELPPEPPSTRIDGANVNAFGNRHGYVEVLLLDGIGASVEGTRAIDVVLDYGPCFEAFYKSDPSWTAEGVSGSPVFDSALTDLCAQEGPELARCEVAEIIQQPDNGKLLVDYELAGLQDGQRLRVGPLPTRGLARCPNDAAVFAGQITMFGLNDQGSLLWRATAANVPAWQDASRELVVRAP